MDEREPPAGGPAVPDQPQSQLGTSPRNPAPTADAAFSAFYRQFVPTLVAFLVWQGARLPDAADLAQVTMIKAHKHWSEIHHPEAWTRRVASRELARHIASIEEEDLAAEIPEHSCLLQPLTDVAAWEQRHEVLRLLDLLPLRQRQVMAWTLDGYSPSEIADELQITAEAVRTSLMRGRRTLAKSLGTTGDER
jgi:RNA polymerase sigma factor (sigma-70 family)